MRSRGRIFLLALCLAALGGGLASLRHWRNGRTPEAIGRRAGLDRRIADLNWTDASPEASVVHLRRLTGARIRLSDEWGLFARDGWLPGPPRVRAHLRNVKLSTALALLADEMPVITGGMGTYEVRPDGTIVVRPSLSAGRLIHWYEIQDLLQGPAAPATMADPVRTALDSAVGPGWPLTFSRAAPPGAPQWMMTGRRLTFVGTQVEQATIAAAIKSLRGPDGAAVHDEAVDALGRRVGPIHARNVPRDELIDRLAVQARVNIFVDWQAFGLRYRSLDPTLPVSVDFERLPLRAALDLLLPLANTRSRPTFAAEDNVLFVTVGWPSSRFRLVRAYDLGDLVRVFAENLRMRESRRRGFHATNSADVQDQAMETLQDLLQLGATLHASRTLGGHAGLMIPSGTRGIVVASADTHRELRRFLQTLREFIKASSERQPAAARLLSGGEDAFPLLETPVAEIALAHAPLSTALLKLQSVTGVTIGIDASVPEAVANTPVTLHMWNLPLRAALRQVLRVAASNGPLGYGIDQGIIIVTADPYQWSLARSYDVRDLVGDHAAQIDQLLALIRSTLEPSGVDNLPVAVDSIQPIGGWLLVTQTPENHRRIEALLRALREDGNESGILVGGP